MCRRSNIIERILRIGTRGSDLALAQAGLVGRALEQQYPGLTVEIVPIKTRADRMQDVAIVALGGKGVFVKEIEQELLRGGVDLAVHSMKDVPVEIPEGLELVAYPPREDPRDVLVARQQIKLESLPRRGRIGTGALRRRMQLLNIMPDLDIVPIRGNVQTRIRKIESEQLDGVVLAAAGLRRMGLHALVSQYISPDIMTPAAGQGVLGIQIRTDDDRLRDMVSFLNHEQTMVEITAERAYLRRLGGGCQVPIAGFAMLQGSLLQVRGMVGSPDGRVIVADTVKGAPGDAEKLGTSLAESVLFRGGKDILADDYT